jgi:hypothetical protein
MTGKLRPLAALAMVALIGAGCSNAPAGSGGTADGTGGGSAAAGNTAREQAVKFSECMRDNGVRDFPDPDASGELTIDGVANESSVNPDTAAFKRAVSACKDLEPAGFTGHKRNAAEQKTALEFARCVRENGVKDFPDPTPDGPLIDTNRIPSAAGTGGMTRLDAATNACGRLVADLLRNP